MRTSDEARRAILSHLDRIGSRATACPSTIARMIAAPDSGPDGDPDAGAEGDWRARMGDVHEAVDALLEEGRVALSWKGERLDRRDGPYRLRLPRPSQAR